VARIVVRAELGPSLPVAFPECDVAVLSGETHLTALVRDEAELFGLVERLRDLGAPVASVTLDPPR
jgi:hypothetical protein